MPKTSKSTTKSTKTAVKKKPAKAAKKPSLSVPVHDTAGKKKGTVLLPKELFAASSSKQLMAQAVRVYLANRRQGGAVAQTRSEVTGSGRKVWRQKGTGRARHGERNAPIFVGGGISHGPRPRDFSMRMNKKMRRKALFAALSTALAEDRIRVIDGLESIAGKTKEVAGVLKGISCKMNGGKLAESVLMTMPGKVEPVHRAGRNIEKLTVQEAQKLTAYIVMHNKKLIISKKAVDTLKNTFIPKGTKENSKKITINTL